jgi:hypothetical protein
MTVYVDDMRARYGRMTMCHMWAGREVNGVYEVALDELLAMVDRIGVQKKWIQGHPQLSLPKARKAGWVHFDISLGKRDLAVKAGAVETDRYEPLIHCARLEGPGAYEMKLRQIGALRDRLGVGA